MSLAGWPAALSAVLGTSQLARRPSRPPQHAREVAALNRLTAALTQSPTTVLQCLAQETLDLVDADSAGVSLLSADGTRIEWPVIVGRWTKYLNSGLPRDASPCGVVVEMGTSQLFCQPHRCFPLCQDPVDPLEEVLLTPLIVEGRKVGTLWAVLHGTDRRFEAEDLRLMESVAALGASGYQLFEAKNQAEMAAAALRDHERRNREFMDLAPAMLWVTDAQGRCTFLSRRWYEFTGAAPESGLGWGYLESLSADDRARSERRFREVHDHRQAFSLDFRLRRDDRGRVTWVQAEGRPRYDAQGAFIGFVGSLWDIDGRKQAEDRLREADRRKDEFLALLAHELRNPLAPISNAVQILANDADARTVDKVCGLLQRQTAQLTRLVDDLLDVSRISRGKLELQRQPVRLGGIIDQAVEAVRPLASTRQQELRVDPGGGEVWVDGDAARLCQAVENLLNNACKFTPERGRIEIRVEPIPAEQRVSIRIRDDGIGISGEDQQRIFDLFTQLDTSLERRSGGLGIGLALVRTLVQMHGGSVSLHSEGRGRGSTFSITLPTVHHPVRSVTPTPSGAARSRRVLVADDNRDAADSLSALLTMLGHRVTVVYDGRSAQAQAMAEPFDCIVLDIGMPDMNGYEVARGIRALRNDTLFVALSGWASPGDRERSADAGFDVHLAKPVDIDALERLLSRDKVSAAPIVT